MLASIFTFYYDGCLLNRLGLSLSCSVNKLRDLITYSILKESLIFGKALYNGMPENKSMQKQKLNEKGREERRKRKRKTNRNKKWFESKAHANSNSLLSWAKMRAEREGERPTDTPYDEIYVR